MKKTNHQDGPVSHPPTSSPAPALSPPCSPMSDKHPPHSLLDELDQRQNEVLQQLEALDQRVETLLRECLNRRQPAQEMAASPSS